MKRWLPRVLNKKFKEPIVVLAIFAVILTIASFEEGELAKSRKVLAEEANTQWLTYYQIYLDNHENISARNMAEQYRTESTIQNEKSFEFDFVSGVYQISIQCSIISLIIFLAALSISNRKILVNINFMAFLLFGLAFAYFIAGVVIQLVIL
jgi:hypothetical protein